MINFAVACNNAAVICDKNLEGKYSLKEVNDKTRDHMSISSHQTCSIKKAALKNFEILTKKHLCWSLFLIKINC